MQLKKLAEQCGSIVFFGGAGVSTESGIPDFRSANGLYGQIYQYPPETILSHSFFVEHPKEFFDFYRDKMLYLDAEPNAAHRALAALEDAGRLKAVITQNIDGLHQAAGSKTVYELHGSVYRNYCMRCGRFYGVEKIIQSSGVPVCECGGIIKPDVVLYQEELDAQTLENAVCAIQHADMLIVGGTSLTVYPPAGLIRCYRGDKLVLINKSATAFDNAADYVINDSVGAVLDALRS